jgi:EXPERA (EXPanded EBP superfamily)
VTESLANLPLRNRKIDIFFAIIFLAFAVTSGISDLVPTLGIPITADSTNSLARANFGHNWIQLPAVIYATMIVGITAVIVFGVEFFGEPEFQTQNPLKFLAFNLPYVLIPLLLLIRMRKPLPFTRRF